MEEFIEMRIYMEYAHLLFKKTDGKNLGDSVKLIKVNTKSDLYEQIKVVYAKLWRKKKTFFFSSWQTTRTYTAREMSEARLLNIVPRKAYYIFGEDYGTKYDESYACPTCGSGGRQISPLKLCKRQYTANQDISRTLCNEIVVSNRFVDFVQKNGLRGLEFGPVYIGGKLSNDCSQLILPPNAANCIDLSPQTKFGADPILRDWDAGSKSEVYICPNGDNIGLNPLSEAYVLESPVLDNYDFFYSRQTFGVRRGYLRPRPLMFCSNRMMRLIKENDIKGFYFEVAHVVDA